MPPPKIKLYIDVVSPFGYIAYYILRHDPVFSKCEITYIPMFLGGVMKAVGNIAPINIKNKDKWISAERTRWAKFFNVPIADQIPEGFPPLTVTVMRAICAVTVLYPGKNESEGDQGVLIKVLDELLREFWVNHRKVYEKDVMVDVLRKVLGEEATGKVAEMIPKEGKEVLIKNTDLALKDGAFGLPWFVVTNSKGETEGFWGVDHLGQVLLHLGLEKTASGGWKSLL